MRTETTHKMILQKKKKCDLTYFIKQTEIFLVLSA